VIKTNEAFRNALAQELAAVRGRTAVPFVEPHYDPSATEAVRASAVRAVQRAIRSSEAAVATEQVRTAAD